MTTEDLERELTLGLRAIVDGEHPPTHVRDRIADTIHSTAPRRSWLPAVAASLTIIAMIGAFLALRDDAPATVEVASETTARDGDPGDDATPPAVDSTTTIVRRSETTDVRPTEMPSDPTSVITAPAVTAPSQSPRTTIAPASPPPPTTVACRDSVDPACGPFRWDPAPVNRPATVTVAAPAGPISTDEQVELTVTMSDPDGRVDLGCFSVRLDRPGLSTGSCQVTKPGECPTRHGPWTPPPPQAHRASTTTVVEFHEAGTYVVTVDVSPADGCDNVDPYRSGGTATITVEVADPATPAGA